MADDDQPKIHRGQEDIEAQQKPTTPLVPHGTPKSDRGGGDEEAYPVFRRTIPVMYSEPPKRRRSCLCKCMCWTVSLIITLIVVIAAIVGILWLAFKPKLPKFSVDRMRMTDFTLYQNSSLEAIANVTITAQNPNEKIGIYYYDGGSLSVYYMDTSKLCEGSLPEFYQGHENTTVLKISLRGQTENATSLVTALQKEQRRRKGNVPLNLRVKQPIRIKLGKLKLMKMNFKVNCRLVVKSLNIYNSISIQNSSCNFRFRL